MAIPAFDDFQTFEVKAAVWRLENTGEFMLEIAVRCRETGDVFEFCPENVTFGYIGTKRAFLNLTGRELSIPIRPPTQDLPPNWTSEQEWDEVCDG